MTSSSVAFDMEFEFDPFSEEMMSHPYETYRLLRKHAPVYFNRPGEFWAVTRYEHSRKVFKDFRAFSNKDGAALDGVSKSPEFFGTTMVIMDPPDHTKLRKQLSPGWTVAEVQKYEAFIRKATTELIDGFIEEGEADFGYDFSWALPIDVISEIVGVDSSDRPWVRERFTAAFKRGPGVVGLPPPAIEAARELRAFFGGLVDERRAHPRRDLLSFIPKMTNSDGSFLARDEVEGYCLMIYSAGVFTTACFLSNSLYALATENDQREKLIRTPEIAPLAVEELLRYESPIQQFCRTAMKDVVLGEMTIKEGERVAIFPGSADRDELVWGETSSSWTSTGRSSRTSSSGKACTAVSADISPASRVASR